MEIDQLLLYMNIINFRICFIVHYFQTFSRVEIDMKNKYPQWTEVVNYSPFICDVNSIETTISL